MKHEIVYIPLNKLRPYANNPRINDDAVDKVAESITQFGFKNPIVCTADYEIINGHTRHKAALKLGLEEVPCIIATDLTEAQIKAFRIIDNRCSDYSHWDTEKLMSELSDIDVLGFDMENFALDFDSMSDSLIDDINGDAEETTAKSCRDDGKGNSMVMIPIPQNRIPDWNSYRKVHGTDGIVAYVLKLLDEHARRK